MPQDEITIAELFAKFKQMSKITMRFALNMLLKSGDIEVISRQNLYSKLTDSNFQEVQQSYENGNTRISKK